MALCGWRRADTEPINMPITSPSPSQKIHFPNISATAIPASAPSINPENESFFINCSVVLPASPPPLRARQRGGTHRPLQTLLARPFCFPCSSIVTARQRWTRLGPLVANQPHLREQVADAHSRERLKQRRHLRRDFRHVAGDLAHPGGMAVAGGDNGDLVDVGKR